MLLAIEHRFDALRTAEPVESLAYNGRCFIAHERSRSPLQLTWSVRSPESKGIAKAFVKTIKPDYILPDPRPGAATLMSPQPGSLC
jgi:hypothetical protein